VLKKPVVLSARGTDINLFTTFPLVRGWIVWALKSCDHVIAVSKALKEIMVRAGIAADKIDVVPNGVDIERFRPISRSEARRMLGLPQGGTILLAVGSLRPTKGFQYLLPAVAKIRESQGASDLTLHIIGYGQYRDKLMGKIARLGLQSSVKLVGRVAHEQLYKWYSAADLFCLPSASEGWPNVIMESLACGLPVMATRVGGVPEILVSEKYGLVLDAVQGSRLVGQLKDGILEALQREWDRDAMVAYARQNTWDKAAHKIDDIFQQTLNDWG
jgi:teichuronic acid biosynthesis glycosyltransferase TuaC